jgi:hypothetical protein
MTKYEVVFRRTSFVTISIEAESEDDAEQKAWDEFNMDDGYFEVGNADWSIERIGEELE